MITIQDWIATIPEEDKHIAFVGEHQSVTRAFWLTGSDWATYEDWGFHLDMAFDLSTVTSRAERQLESTQVSTIENVSDTQVETTGNTTKEKYTVTEVEVDCDDKTDIASLQKEVLSEGIRLTWTVLRQHTQLPGKLKATLRALGPDGQVKKSDLMVFEVEPAVVAEAAAEIPQSEFEAMEEHMDEMLDAVLKNAQMVEIQLEALNTSVQTVRDIQTEVNTTQDAVNQKAEEVKEAVDRVLNNWPITSGGFDLEMGTNWLNLREVTYNKGQLANGLVGNDSSLSLSLTGYIPVKEGDVLSYQCTDSDTGERTYGNLYAVCLFDEAGAVNFDANQYKAGEDGTLHEITIPAGVAYVRLTLHHLDTAVDPAIAPCQELIPYEKFWVVRKLKAEGYDIQRMEPSIQPVRYAFQTLTEEQKSQARANIGAVEPEEMLQLEQRVTALEQIVGNGITVDETLDLLSDNPIANKAVAQDSYNISQNIQRIDAQLANIETMLDSILSQIGGADA